MQQRECKTIESGGVKMEKEFLVTVKILLLFLMVFTIGTNTSANSIIEKDELTNVSTQNLLRFIDTKEKYGKSCEEYNYIPSLQRLKLLKQHNFLLGDILSDTLSISSVNPNNIVETNLTECNMQDMHIGEYTYSEKLSYLSENIVTIEVMQYMYGVGSAHVNRHISHYIYDRQYGMRIDWANLFGENEAFDKYVLKRVVKEIADEDFISYFKSSKQLFNFRNPGYFAIIDEGMRIQYGKYEITPGASGLPSIVVSKETLKQYMSKETYEKCFGTKDQVIVEARNDH